MKQSLYSIFDIKAKVYARPFVQINDDVAKRAFEGAVNTPETDLNKYPHDYALVKLADYEDTTGTIDPCEIIETLCHGHDVWQKPEPIKMPEYNGEN